MPDIFLSHSSADNAFTRFLADRLIEAGFGVWVDFDGIRSGDRWVKSIQDAVEDCGAMVVVMSRAGRDSEWVEREALMAMDLKKPLHIALIEDIPLPLHLINRQFTDFRNERGRATKKLTSVLRRLDLTKPKTRAPKKLSPEPDKDNFFKYLAQLPGGEQNALIARDLYRWAKDNADTIEFGGKVTPGFHVRVDLGDSDIIVFSLWGYRRKPAVQVQFQYMAEVAPYHDSKLRRSTLVSLNRLLDDPLIDDAADRRPTLPLKALDAAAKLEMFQQIMAEIMDNLRSV
jgi:hypothetical protein